MPKSCSEAIWQPDEGVAEVTRQVGSRFSTMGVTTSTGKLLLNSEETLYTLEQRALILRWNDSIVSPCDAYSVLLRSSNLDDYLVYARLRSHKFVVFRCERAHALSSRVYDVYHPQQSLKFAKSSRTDPLFCVAVWNSRLPPPDTDTVERLRAACTPSSICFALMDGAALSLMDAAWNELQTL
eukprot:TRINITY_DN1544_c0_g2_i1.p1 TRINITY_DN1544_c0_g2~~TRINITY_DN1544_c0_g2_i1.p1  ORF type:complete len:183 (-),score=16.96 TRINITY_DN1544_c0_g2_i1:128-676(-)